MKKVLLLVAILLLSASVVYAECSICDMAASESYGERTCYKIVRGLGNTLLGWTELFFRPIKESKEGVPVITGVVSGIGNALARTGSGVIELVTFWNPAKEDAGAAKDCPICAMK